MAYWGDAIVVYEIALDPQLINTDPAGLWIRSAGQTLVEALVLAGGRLLDIEFSEIKSGYNLKVNSDYTSVLMRAVWKKAFFILEPIA